MLALFVLTLSLPVAAQDAAGSVVLTGEPHTWHRVVLVVRGPATEEQANPNPFVDFRLTARFEHAASGRSYEVPGFFAADGRAADSGAVSGDLWHVHFRPDAPGRWNWSVSFRRGRYLAVRTAEGKSAGAADGARGSLDVTDAEVALPDFRARGRLEVVGATHRRFAGDGSWFLKCGVDAPENLLAYADFDGDFASDGHRDDLVKTWEPHLRDARDGDPTWGDDARGKGLLGALNYLAGQGLNGISFLTLNIGGDDRNVFPYTSYDERLRFDVSKLAQWDRVFSHAQSLGLHLHFKTSEAENQGLLDGGGVGLQRTLYYRELIARFGDHLALTWNVGEENGEWFGEKAPTVPQTTAQRRATIALIRELDPYDHHVVIHNGRSFDDLLGDRSELSGVSVQTHRPDFAGVHGAVRHWVEASRAAGRPWVVACDEPGDAQHALVPDAEDPEHDDARRNALWGALLAGGEGIEWYFGYAHAESDLTCQDFRVREAMWAQCRHALRFFREQRIPYHAMRAVDLSGVPDGVRALSTVDEGRAPVLVVQTPPGCAAFDIDLPPGTSRLRWFDPKRGTFTEPEEIVGSRITTDPPGGADEWILLLR